MTKTTASWKKVAVRALGAAALASFVCATVAEAQTRMVPTQSYKHRRTATNLGDYDPWGQPARAGCTWSRIQVPTSQGLRWQAIEDCNPDMWH
jgi:hypothetical protein